MNWMKTSPLQLVLLYYLGISLITFVLFAVDKGKAKRGVCRISEATLLGCSLIGGAPGGLLAMHLCHHKTRKPGFRYGVPLMLCLHVIVIGYLFLKK